MNELRKRAQYHAQKQAGLSPFCSMGEGIEVKKDTVIDFNFTKEVMYDVEKHLSDNKDTRYLIDDLSILNDRTFGIFVRNGDWKHEHHYLEKVVGEYLKSLGLEFDHFTKLVGHSDSDCYSAYHYFELKQAEPVRYDSESEDETAAEEAQYYANKLFTPVECRGVTYYPKLELQEGNNSEIDDASYTSSDRYYGGLSDEPEYTRPKKKARYWEELILYFKTKVRQYPNYYVIGTSPVTVTLKTPDGKETIDLTKFDALADADEAIEMASHYFDESLFEARKKKKNGALVNPDAGNVEHNIEMFNKMNSPVDGPSNNPISGPFGGDVCAESLNEAAPKKETIELEYKDLEFTQYGTKRDVDDWDEWDRCMDWTYEVDKDDLYTFIFESCIDESDFPEAFEDEFDPNNAEHWARFESWLDDNFDTIYSKYEEKILENWEEDAQKDAAEQYDPDDYVDWDSMPGGHDDDRYWEGFNEEYKCQPRMIDYFEQMNSEDDEA